MLGTAMNMDVPLMSAGLDSLLVAELAQTFSCELCVEVTPTDLFDHPTLTSIVHFLQRKQADSETYALRDATQESQSEEKMLAETKRGRTVIIRTQSFEFVDQLKSRSGLRPGTGER